jgi:hypothetical protein
VLVQCFCVILLLATYRAVDESSRLPSSKLCSVWNAACMTEVQTAQPTTPTQTSDEKEYDFETLAVT